MEKGGMPQEIEIAIEKGGMPQEIEIAMEKGGTPMIYGMEDFLREKKKVRPLSPLSFLSYNGC